MNESLGLVETRGLVTAIIVADAMVKSANVNIIEVENSRGLGYMTVKICGDVGAVTAAVACGKQIAIENNAFVSAKVIARPSKNVETTFCQPKEKVSKENKEINEIQVNVEVEKDKSLQERESNIEVKISDEIESDKQNHLEEKQIEKQIEKQKSLDKNNIDIRDEIIEKDDLSDNKYDSQKENNKDESPKIEEKKTKRPGRKKSDPKKK